MTSSKIMDPAKVQEMQMKVLGDLASTAGVACAYVGDRLGLYKTMAESGPITSQELAERTKTSERYVREWLVNQAAGGYINYDSAAGRYDMSAEQAAVLAHENSPAFAAGGFQSFVALVRATARIVECFKTAEGLPWGEQDSDLFEGTERFFRPGYMTQLISHWIPSIRGLKEKLDGGAVVADVGCGHGISTLIMAKAFPKSRFFGFDSHAKSIERATQEAQQSNLSDRVSFHTATAVEIPERSYDMIAFFDCLHDMGNPVEVCKRVRALLAPGGQVMLVEPMAGRTVEDNFNPVGRVYAGASVLCCTPNAISSGGMALGTVATDSVLAEVFKTAGFSYFERTTETPFNRVFEARV